PARSMADPTTWAEPGGVRSTTRLPEWATSTTHSPNTRFSCSSGAGRSSNCGTAYTVSPPGMRTLTAPSSSRSRETVACVAITPSLARRSTTCAWLVTAFCSSNRAMRCCRCGFASLMMRRASYVLHEKPVQEAPLGVEAVLGLLPHQTLRAFEHRRRDLFAAVGREAMEEHGVRRSRLHE